MASRYGREITERALERVVKKVREERTTKLIEEFEEINKHSLTGSPHQHIVGLYRWVDKIYQAKIVNYGKRLMFEFLIPEPAAFHLHAVTQAPIESTTTLMKPLDPRTQEAADAIGMSAPITDHTDIEPWNYGAWAAAYGAAIEPPPPLLLTTSKAYHRDAIADNTQFADSKNDLKVIEGYQALSAQVHYGMHKFADNWVTVFVGRGSQTGPSNDGLLVWLVGEDDFVPINIMGKSTFYALSVEVTCERTDETYQKWKIKTFNAILKAYQDKLANYENALAQAKAQAGVQIRGTNPLLNREIEKQELKKGAIRLLAQNCDPLWSNAMKDNQQCGYPEFDCGESLRDSPYVQFVEQAFEWKLTTYLFYPYFWGRKCNWEKIYQLDDVDPLFLAFLQAGYARVVVPVREGYNEAALRFLTDGTLFNGDGVPGVDSPMYLAIANEMKQLVGEVDPSVKPWEIRVPTTLTVLQCDSGCAPGTGLPCRRDEEVHG